MSPTGVSECSNNRVHINSFPLQSTSYLQHLFTFYFCGQHERMATNDLIENNMLRTYDPPDYLWTGNVLVVKHAAPCTTTIADVLVNVEREDFGLIKVILEWLIARNVDTRLTYPNPHRQLLTFPPVFSADPLKPPHRLFSVRDLREIVFGYCGIKSLFNLALGNFDFYAHVRQFFTSHFLTPKGLLLTLTITKAGDSIAESVAVGSHYAYCLYPDLLEEGIIMPLDEDLPLSTQRRDTLNNRGNFMEDNRDWHFACGILVHSAGGGLVVLIEIAMNRTGVCFSGDVLENALIIYHQSCRSVVVVFALD
ncbi:uncharacterized protein C8R40DRAFT_1073202 [Lentinula edodes]|uniref:uncharacterized protein n=1 Tax=Lentinula edodes TaxID=5353 RepID=UPI001E8EE409|nr:uncharacterized protein C8R40DRAFT_1073202 [Lentinula edodes]KAH7870476.1 hypothetical protein C8R40DRAFT_1073202 [Lentinula edodes]